MNEYLKMYERQIAAAEQEIVSKQKEIEYLRNAIKEFNEYDSLPAHEKVIRWAKHQGYMYKPEILENLKKQNVDHRFIDALNEHTMYRWTSVEVEDLINTVKEKHGI